MGTRMAANRKFFSKELIGCYQLVFLLFVCFFYFKFGLLSSQ